MKRKTRTITVNDQQYVWWYRLGGGAIIIFSLINDKTSMITVEFPCEYKSKYDEGYPEYIIEGFPEYIIMKKDNKEYCVKTIEPKMASLMLSYLSCDAFKSRKNIIYNGYDLLSKMGYIISEVKEGLYW